MKKKTTKDKTVFKAKIIIILKGGEVITGDGVVTGLRTNDGKKAHITADFTKDFPVDFL
jgi:hypothetical protein